MGSTEHVIGLNDSRSSSRVLKPPGGGHSNIFSPPEEIKPHARPKYDQQNSSNLNFCMNTVDPNEKVAKITADVEAHDHHDEAASISSVDAAQHSQAPPQPAHEDKCEASPNPNLPTYHHHRSTKLW